MDITDLSSKMLILPACQFAGQRCEFQLKSIIMNMPCLGVSLGLLLFILFWNIWSVNLKPKKNPKKKNWQFDNASVNVLLFSGRYTLDWGLKGILFNLRHQTGDIKWLQLTSWWTLNQDYSGVLRSKKPRTSDLDSVASLHSLNLECFFCVQVGVTYFWTSFSDYLSLLKSKSVCPCYRSAVVALGLSVKFLCHAVVCG